MLKNYEKMLLEMYVSRYTKCKLVYQVLLTPSVQERLADEKIVDVVRAAFAQCAQGNGLRLQEVTINPDHVQLLVEGKPALSAERIIAFLKNDSSAAVQAAFPGVACAGGGSFWSEGYVVETVGGFDRAALEAYLQNARRE